MPTGKTISMTEAGILPFGTRVYAKYRGAGRVKVPSHQAMEEPHFDNDYYVEWESGGYSWLGKDALQVLSR